MHFKVILTGGRGGGGRREKGRRECSFSFLSFCPADLKLPSRNIHMECTWTRLGIGLFGFVLFRPSNMDATVIWREEQTMSQANGTFKGIIGVHTEM